MPILETEKMLQFGTKNPRRAWYVIPAQEIDSGNPWTITDREQLQYRIVEQRFADFFLHRTSFDDAQVSKQT